MGFAVGKSFVLEKCSIIERLAAFFADETVGMPLHIEGGDVVLSDGVAATPTLGCELLEVAVLAVGTVILLMEAIIPKLFSTVCTKKVLWVPSLVQSRNTLVQDRTLAVTTPGGEQMMVILLTVRFSIPFEEVPSAQLLVTMGAIEMLRVPGSTKSCDNLSNYRFVTGCANSFLGCFNALFVHIFL